MSGVIRFLDDWLPGRWQVAGVAGRGVLVVRTGGICVFMAVVVLLGRLCPSTSVLGRATGWALSMGLR